ncbi:pentapeptide repeat-containing protein [Streptomyces sp. NPDC057445]|uniref:pentapeptide repeat-containing protein n=1 Tax=Streptomyces sp. NPDC057445 TaxID=3346136 RepID=UPI0036B2BBDD
MSPRFGRAWFTGATFAADAGFGNATFSGDAGFGNATFLGDAWFTSATFSGDASFGGATFSGDAWFTSVTFSAKAWFGGATFSTDVGFTRARFSGAASFGGATFSAKAWFGGATFSADARFDSATFSGAPLLGPLVCLARLDLSGAVFAVPVVIEVAAESVVCTRTRWESTATLRLRYASVDLSDAVVTQPIAVTAHLAPFVTSGSAVDESVLTGDADVRITSLRGVDAAHLVLTNTDLTECRFFGAFHLDQLRLEGETIFARTPPGADVRRGIPVRWTDRLTLAEEHHWRALPTQRPRLRSGWTSAPPQSGPAVCPPGPPALAALYRQLRKAFEDGKDEPGAADFYYAEMDMRRLDRRTRRNEAERWLLTAYWALSGYGLRASRALTWLGLSMTATVLAMMLWGLPTSDPKPITTGTQAPPGQPVRLVTDNPDPILTGSPHERLTGKRAEKATRVVLNSVVFRSSGQNLTTTGAYIEMTSRIVEPVLLGLAALAIRGRVKR